MTGKLLKSAIGSHCSLSFSHRWYFRLYVKARSSGQDTIKTLILFAERINYP